jgi:hypothetical protein
MQIPWNKGLTKNSSVIIKEVSDKKKQYKPTEQTKDKIKTSWNNKTDDEKDIRSNVLFYKQYSVLSKRYTISKFASELKEDFTKIRFSKLEDKFHIEPFVENDVTAATNFLCSDNSLILVSSSINECGICFEQTKRKIDCCKNIVCYPCQLKITRKPFYHEEFECYEATPCPFCRRVIDTEFKFDEEDNEETDEESDEEEDEEDDDEE